MNILLALLLPIVVGGSAGEGITVYYDDIPAEHVAVWAMRCPGVESGIWTPTASGRVKSRSYHDGRWTAGSWWGSTHAGRFYLTVNSADHVAETYWYLAEPSRPVWMLTPQCPQVFAPLVIK